MAKLQKQFFGHRPFHDWIAGAANHDIIVIKQYLAGVIGSHPEIDSQQQINETALKRVDRALGHRLNLEPHQRRFVRNAREYLRQQNFRDIVRSHHAKRAVARRRIKGR